MGKLHWVGFCLTVFGFVGILGCILVSVLGISCYSPSNNSKMWSDRIGDRFELVKLSDIKQLDGSFVFGTGDIKVDNKVVFAYRNKQGDIQIGSTLYDNIKIRYGQELFSYILIEYNDCPYNVECSDLQDALKSFYSPIRYVIFCIPENGDKDFIKDWK